MPARSSVRFFQFLIAAMGWFALITQFCLLIQNRVLPVGETVIQYFSYFTILTNMLVACWFTTLFFGKGSSLQHFFSRSNNATAITVYITIVGLVYNLVLRFLWNPAGLQKLADEMLHSVIPVAVIIYWLALVPKGELQWKNSFPWLIYPIVYCVYIMARGAFSTVYPYPFMDVNNLGYPAVMRNIGILCGVFVLFSLAFISIDRLMARALAKK